MTSMHSANISKIREVNDEKSNGSYVDEDESDQEEGKIQETVDRVRRNFEFRTQQRYLQSHDDE